MNDEKKDLYIELKALDQQIKQLQGHIESIDTQLTEIRGVKTDISEFSKLEPGTEIKVPLTNGIFFDAKLVRNKELLVNVGANVSVAKDIPQINGMLSKQEEELKSLRSTLVAQFESLVTRVEEIQAAFSENK